MSRDNASTPEMTTTLATRGLTLAVRGAAALVLALFVTASAGSGSARAAFGVHDFSATLRDTAGAPAKQAAAHPDLVVQYTLNQAPNPSGPDFDDGQTREVVVTLPKGFYGNPQAVPQCPRALLIGPAGTLCPPDTQIGILGLQYSPDPANPGYFEQPIYNLAPGPDESAAFGIFLLASPIGIVSTVSRDGEPVIQATLRNISQGLTYYGVKMTLWGVPGDAAHDPKRAVPGDPNSLGSPNTAPIRTFLTTPSDCSEPMVSRIRASSWQNPTDFVEQTDVEPAPTGCDKLRLTHSISVAPTDPRADSPSGYDVAIDVPQDDAPKSLGTPPLRRIEVTLPEGATLSPSSAAGLTGCPDVALAFERDAEPSCPDSAKIGTVAITTPLLAEDLAGTVYVGAPTPEAMFRLFLVIKGPGVLLKVRGTVHPDPATGRLTAVFDDLPELPFSSMRMHLDGGPAAAMANPDTCGAKASTATLGAWAGTESSASGSFAINAAADGGPCPAAMPFAPSFSAGTVVPTAGASSPFTMTLRRNDGDQQLSDVAVTLPPGLLGDLSGIPRCDGAAADSGACDPASQVGTTTTESGPGSRPLALPGKVFLGGPYKGAPFSLVIAVPAQAGPYDLGTVVVRSTLSIDPVDAHVTVQSDPLPTILQGVPLRIRTVNVLVDRPGFMVSPTSCAPTLVSGQITSVFSTVADVSDRYQVGGCAALALKPKLTMALTGRGQTTDGDHPGLSAQLTMPAMREANLKKVTVSLPLSLALDPDNSQSNDLCEFVDGQKTIPECPAASIVGAATARTPILDEPLTGPVYFIKNVRTDPKSGRQIKTLPTLATVLRGGGVTLVVRATTAVVHDQLVTTFANIPDAPVSSFQLTINGGKKDILVVSGADICAGAQVAAQVAYGQNGKIDQRNITIKTPDCPLKVVSKKVSTKAVTLKVSGLGAGKLTVSGRGIRTTSRTIAAASTATIVAKRTGRKAPAALEVSFKPVGSSKTRTATASLRSAAAKTAKSAR
jgi:hypothetical protein